MGQAAEKPYPVLCAWCPRYGRRPAVIRMVSYAGSHGICEECIRQELGSERLNGGERSETDLSICDDFDADEVRNMLG